MKWKTIKGTLLDIKDMSTLHVKNCIKLIEKNIDISNRNNAPSYYMKEIHYEVDYSEHPKWNAFHDELKRRSA